jgi:hypothetical protein
MQLEASLSPITGKQRNATVAAYQGLSMKRQFCELVGAHGATWSRAVHWGPDEVLHRFIEL